LQYYADHSNFTSNRRFVFLEGEHHLHSVVNVTQVDSLSLVGVGQSKVKIDCQNGHSGFYIEKFIRLSIEGLALSKTAMVMRELLFFILTGSEACLQHIAIANDSSNASIALMAVDVIGSFSIINSSFVTNQGQGIIVQYMNCQGHSLLIMNSLL
jgi:hypothetical protein